MKLFFRPLTGQQHGFGLVETLVAMVVLTIGILAVYTMQVTAVASNAKASTMTLAANRGIEVIEGLIETSYDNVEDIQDDGDDGHGEEGLYFPYEYVRDQVRMENHAKDDEASKYPPDDTTEIDNYIIYTNVAEDYPVEGCKTIQVLVRDSGKVLEDTPIILRYTKQDSI